MLQMLLFQQLVVKFYKLKVPVAQEHTSQHKCQPRSHSRLQQASSTKSVKACKNTGAAWCLNTIIKDVRLDEKKL